jgi:hypothetical protein
LKASYDDNALEATNALVFMAVALNSSWKLPVGYFLVTSISGKKKCKKYRSNKQDKVIIILTNLVY